MRNKIFITILAGVVVAALIGVMWWWFLSRPNEVPTSISNPFGVFPSAQQSPSASGNATTTTPLVAGTYTVNDAHGNKIGLYVVSPAPTQSGAPAGSYTLSAVDGPSGLLPGTYAFVGSNGLPVSYSLAQVGIISGASGTLPVYMLTPEPVSQGGFFHGLSRLALLGAAILPATDTYTLVDANGNTLGSYAVNPAPTTSGAPAGSYTMSANQGPATVPGGTYNFTNSSGQSSQLQVTQVGTINGSTPVYAFSTPNTNSTTATQLYSPVSTGSGVPTGAGVAAGSGVVAGPGVSWFVPPPTDQPFFTGVQPGAGVTSGSGVTTGTGVTTGSGVTAGSGALPGGGVAAGSGVAGGAGVATGPGVAGGAGVATGGGVPVGPGVSTSTANGYYLSAAPYTVFNPTGINQVANFNPQGGLLPNLGGSMNGLNPNGSGLGVAGTLLGAGAIGAVSCMSYLIGGAIASLIPTGLIAVQVNQPAKNSEDVMSCLAREVAKATLRQITASVVDWINNGFNGSPSFVLNPAQFFSNIADQTAGQFIQGSSLSFLCSPFSLQVKIAIAQSYAYRDPPPSCTLNGVVNNVNNFLNGGFSNGGWPGLLTMTTMPENNPYGAYAAASLQLNAALNNAQGQQQIELLQGNGFLSFKQEQNCQPAANQNVNVGSGQQLDATPNGNGGFNYRVCDVVNTTPGHVIAGAIDKSLGQSQDELNLAKSFDEIISALITQLMTNTLQRGLAALSGQGGYASNYYTTAQLAAQQTANQLQTQIENSVVISQQYATVQQGSIQDIQTAQNELNNLYNCWNGVASAASQDPNGAAIAANAQTQAAQAKAAMNQLQPQIDAFNNNITTANQSITTLQQLDSQALSAGSAAQVAAAQAAYNADIANGTVLTQNDLTTAQQNRTALQQQLAAINAQTTAGLTQCHATQP